MQILRGLLVGAWLLASTSCASTPEEPAKEVPARPDLPVLEGGPSNAPEEADLVQEPEENDDPLGAVAGTATVHAETTQGFAFDITVRWHTVRKVKSEDDMAAPCGWMVGSPFNGSGQETYRAVRLDISSEDTSPGGFKMEFPFALRFTNGDDPYGQQLACPGGEAPQRVEIVPGEDSAVDLLWRGLPTPNNPTGFATRVWNAAEVGIEGLGCVPLDTTGSAKISDDCVLTATTSR